MRIHVLPLLFACLLPFTLLKAEEPAKKTGSSEVKKSEWSGYDRLDFQVDGRDCTLILPKEAAPGKPWVWRPEFFDHEPQADLALVKKGYHMAYMDLRDMYGAPKAIAHMEKFHAHLTANYQFAARPAVVGLSRGGLFALNWALAHPDKVSSIYLDAAVCDFRSWPASIVKGKYSADDWARCKKLYGFATDEDAKASKLSPIDRCAELAKTGVPILCVCGDADEVVPLELNCGLLEKRCAQYGLKVTMIIKPGVMHHPHSLVDPTPIVDFILKHQKP